MNNLWEKSNYKSSIQFLIDHPIREYDITKANISVLKEMNKINLDQYTYLLNCPKLEREIYIGKMQGSDSSVSIALKEGIAQSRKIFMEKNNILPNEVLSINNDSITVLTDRPIDINVTDFIKFRLSGDYRSFYKIKNLSFYYNFDIITKKEILDIKGLGSNAIPLHADYMLDFLSELFYSAQIEGVENAINILSTVYGNYTSKKLDVGFYRELNPESRFKLLGFSSVRSLYMDYIIPSYIKYVDISYNEDIFRLLNKIYSSIYFK